MIKTKKYYVFHGARIIQGLTFFVMGLNGFFHFLSMPGKGDEAQQFVNALAQTEYFWPFEKIVEIIFGLFLLCNRFVPLAVDGLAPIVINIMLFHLFLDLEGIAPGLLVLSTELTLFLILWKRHFRSLFKSK